MHILGFHAGKHDSGAYLFEDQTLLAFIKEERLNRIKNAGGQFELAAVDEVCSIAGIDRKKIDVVVFSHGIFPKKCNKLINHSPLSYYLNCKGFFRNFRHSLSGRDRLFRSFSLYRKNLQLQINDIVDEPVLKAAMGLRPDCRIEYIGHHFSHIAAAVKYTDWQEKALYISADGGGDGAFYSAYYLNDGKLECLLGTLESTRFVPQNSGASMGLAYARITELAGFRKNRHEGKITGLAAFGKPVAAEKIAAHFFINQEGCVDSEFKNGCRIHSGRSRESNYRLDHFSS